MPMLAMSRSQNRFLKNSRSAPTMTAIITTTYATSILFMPLLYLLCRPALFCNRPHQGNNPSDKRPSEKKIEDENRHRISPPFADSNGSREKIPEAKYRNQYCKNDPHVS